MFPALVVFGAEYLVYAIAAAAALGVATLPREIRTRAFIFAALALPLAFLIAKTGGLFYAHPQPFVSGNFAPLISHRVDNAFPSDHALLAAAAAVVLLPFRRRAGIALLAAATLIGASRVYAGLHATVDIAGSFAAAVIAGAAAWFLLRRFLLVVESGD